MPQALPANPNLDWLRKTAKARLAELRAAQPETRLHQAQLAVAQAYGFSSWRALKAHVDRVARPSFDKAAVFAAARSGDTDAVRRAFASGFDPATPDVDGRTVHQIAKDLGHAAIEILARDTQGGIIRPAAEADIVQRMLRAAQSGDVAGLRAVLDAHPHLIDALGGGFQKATALHLAALRNQHATARLLIARGADPDSRDFPDNATPLQFAAAHADVAMVRLLAEGGADVNYGADDYEVGVLGWATCFGNVREDVAAYLIGRGARLNLWTAIALDREDDVRSMIAGDRALLTARMTRNQHRRTPLHHAAAQNRPRMVRLLLELGADPNARDATGVTALTTASQEKAGEPVIAALLAAGDPPDLLTAINLGRDGEAEALVRADPSRIGPDGADTIALHLAVSRKNIAAIRWLLAHGIDVNAKRPMWDCNHTALHMTVERGELEIARMLLDAGADPDIRDDKYHATALGWANFFGRADFADLIRQKGGT